MHRSVAVAGAALIAVALIGCGPDAGTAAHRDEVGADVTSTTAAPEPAIAPAPEGPPTTLAAPTTTTTTAPPLPPTAAGALDGVTVVVDPGHNGANYRHPFETARRVDAGGYLSESCNTTGTATVDGYTESAFNWAVAGLLAELLRARGATVQMTRVDDAGWGPCIDRRGTLAREIGATALVSIHADGSAATGFGYHVIHPGEIAGYTDGIVAPSLDLAEAVSGALADAGFLPSSYVWGAPVVERSDLATLNNAGVPAVMLEAGNLRNPFEALVLRDPATQERLAMALADAVTTMFSAAP